MVASSATPSRDWTPASSSKPCAHCGAKKRCQVGADGTSMCYGGPFNGAHGPHQSEIGEYWIGGGDGLKPTLTAAAAPRRELTPAQLGARYIALLSHLSLSAGHQRTLYSKGLLEPDIARMGIKTLGRDRQQAAQRVADLYPDWRDIPGFYVDEKGRPNLSGSPGYLLPCWDIQGRIVAFQIRKDDDSSGKCEWFSSSSKGGCGSGAQFSFYAGSEGTNRVRVTEGQVKAYRAAIHTGVTTISAPGVALFGSERLIDMLLELSCLVVILAPDADFRTNKDVFSSTQKAIVRLQAAGFKTEIEVWDEKAKGIDDAISAGVEIQAIPPETFLQMGPGRLQTVGDPGPLLWEQPESTPSSEEVWEDPEPVESLPPAAAFPVNCLNEKVARFVEGRAEELQTPMDLQALTVLGAASVPLLGAIKVNPYGSWIEPIGLLCAPIAPPGELKSATVRAIFSPHEKEEARVAGLFEAEKKRRRAARRILELEMRDAKRDGDSDRISALHEKLEELEPPTRPQIVLDDPTDEARAKAMAENKGRIGIASAEGTLFSGVAKYSADGAPCVDTILKGHAGDTLRINRVGREPIYIPEANIGGVIMPQPDVVQRLSKHPDLKGVGFQARWFWAYPESRMGQRDMNPRVCPAQCYADWESICRKLFTLGADVENPRSLHFSPQAVCRLRDWRGEIEPMLAGELVFMRDWASKLSGLTVRLSGILHCLDHCSSGDGEFSGLINLETLERGIQIARYALAHAKRAYFLMGYKHNQHSEGADAELLVRLRSFAEPGKRIQVRELHRKLDGQARFKRKESLDLVLGALQRKGWLRVTKVSTGGRPSESIDLHPRFFELVRDRDRRDKSEQCA